MTSPTATSLIVSLFVLTACGGPEPQPQSPPPVLACHDLGDRVHRSPLDEQAGKIAVQPLTADDLDDYDRDESSVAPSRPVGARMSFGAPMGWTRPWLQRWVACYRATEQGKGADLLVYERTEVEVRSLSGAFAIDVVSMDRELAQRIQTEAEHYETR